MTIPRPSANQMNQRAMQLFAAHGRTPTVAPYRDWGNLFTRKPGETLLDDCGTEAGYSRHIRNREPVCASCHAAHAAYCADYKARNGRKPRKRAA